MTHLIPATAHAVQHNQFRALCGRLVDGADHARDGVPECPECRAQDEEDAADILGLAQAPQASFGGPPVKHREFDPCAGYVPRGQRRTR
jgi:hypothetical protein